MQPSESRVFVYWMPQCRTSQKAVEFLQQLGVHVIGYRDLKNEKLSEAEVRELACRAGGADKIFNRRAIMYRVLDLDKVILTEEDMIRHMTAEHTFIRRPVLVTDSARVHTGYHEGRMRDFFGVPRHNTVKTGSGARPSPRLR